MVNSLSVKGFIEREGILDGAEDRAKVECRILIIKHYHILQLIYKKGTCLECGMKVTDLKSH